MSHQIASKCLDIFSRGGSFITREPKIPIIEAIEKAIIGTGFSTSAIRGDAIVVNLAMRLHIPKAVEVKMTGNTIGVDK